MEKVQLTPTGEQVFSDVRPDFLYRIIVHEVVHPEEEVYVYGATTMISAAGDLVIQNGNGQRVFGVAATLWFGFYIVDQETLKPVPQFFKEVAYD